MSHLQVARRRALQWLLGVAALVAAGLALRLLSHLVGVADGDAVVALSHARDGALTDLARGISILGHDWILLPLAVAGAAIPGARDHRWAGAASVLAAIVVQNVVKVLVARPRPAVAHLEHVTSSSFPSGHATEFTALVVAVTIAAAQTRGPLARRAAIGAAAVSSCLVAAARVYLGVHYPTDVAAGIVLGCGCATVGWRATRPVSSRPHRRLTA